MSGRCYGFFTTFADLFTDRQLVALTTLSAISLAQREKRIRADAVAAGLPDDDTPLRDSGDRVRRPTPRRWQCYLGLAIWISRQTIGNTDL